MSDLAGVLLCQTTVQTQEHPSGQVAGGLTFHLQEKRSLQQAELTFNKKAGKVLRIAQSLGEWGCIFPLGGIRKVP